MADTDVQGMLVRIEATTAQLRLEMSNADRVVDRSSSSINRNLLTVDRAFDRTGQAAQQAGVLMKGVFAALAGAGLVGTIIKQADEYGQMADRLRMATGSAEEYQSVQKRLLQTAQETYRPLHEAQELYIRTADVMKTLGFNTQETLDITDSFSFLLVTNAASADKASSALAAYSKSLQTGKIDSDSWIAIQSAMPTVVQAIVAATGKTAKEVRDLGISGKLALMDVNQGFLDTLSANRKAAADMATSVNDALNNIGNAFQDLIGRANETTSATGALAQGLGLLAKHLEPTLIVVAAGAFGAFAGSMIKSSLALIESTRNILAQRGAAIASARAAVAAAEAQAIYARSLLAGAEAAVAASTGMARLSLVQSELIPKQIAATAATNSLTAAQERLSKAAAIGSVRGLLGLLGGPVGLALTLGLTATAFLAMSSGADQTKASIIDLKQPIAELRAELQGLNRDQKNAALTTAVQQQAKAIGDADDAYAEFLRTVRQKLGSTVGTRLAAEFDEARKSGKGLSDTLDSVIDRFGLPQSGIDELRLAAGGYSDMDSSAQRAAERVAAINKVIDEGSKKKSASTKATNDETEAAKKYLEQLDKQYETLLDKTAAEAAERLIKKENLDTEGALAKKIRDRAKAIDEQKAADDAATKAKQESASATGTAAKQQLKSFETTEEGYKRQIELINTTGDKTKDATEVMKLSFELQEGKLGKLTEAQKKKLQGMAAELDTLNALKKANEDALKLEAFRNAQGVGTQTMKDGFEQELKGVGMGDKARDRLRADLALQQKYAADVVSLNEQLQAKNIDEGLYESQKTALDEALAERIIAQELYYQQVDELQTNWMNGVNEAWANYADAARNYSQQAADLTSEALGTATSGLGTFFYDVATGAENAGDALGKMIGNFAQSMLKALADMAAQWLIYKGIQMLVGKTTQVSAAGTMAANAEATSLQAGLAAFASTAAIPIIGPIAAPGAMAAALAVTQPLAAAVGMTAMAGAGFMKGGFTGLGANDEVAGPVHRNEFVMDAEATARIGVGRLEALSDGRMSIMGSGGGSPSTAPAPGRESPSKGLTVNLIEDRSRAGQSERGTNSDGSEYLNLWAAQIRAGGNDTSDSLEAAYGLQRQAL